MYLFDLQFNFLHGTALDGDFSLDNHGFNENKGFGCNAKKVDS